MWISSLRLLASLLLSGIAALALEVRVLPEFFRPDPFGNVVEPDRSGEVWADAVRLRSARLLTHLITDYRLLPITDH